MKSSPKRIRMIVWLCIGAALCLLGLCWFFHPHRYGEWTVVRESDCINAGLRERVCFCGKTESEEISKLNHDSVFFEAKEPACTEPGHTVGFRCMRCDTVLSGLETIPALDHDYSDGLCTRCSAVYPYKTWPLPKPGDIIETDDVKVVTAEEAKKASFSTVDPADYKGVFKNLREYWQSIFKKIVCMADITLLETVDCLWYREDGTLRLPVTIARCRVNAVYNSDYGCTLQAGDEVTIALKASLYAPYHAVGPLKKQGRYLVSLDDLSALGEGGYLRFKNSAQYMAVEEQWYHLEVTGASGDNPKVDTVNMGLIYGLDEMPGCENYLEWGTQNVARFFADVKAAEEKRLGYEFTYEKSNYDEER